MAKPEQPPLTSDGTGDAQEEDFETALAGLEETVRVLEEGELPLEEALKRFEEGMRLLKRCETALKQAERRIEILLGDGEEARREPFEPDA